MLSGVDCVCMFSSVLECFFCFLMFWKAMESCRGCVLWSDGFPLVLEPFAFDGISYDPHRTRNVVFSDVFEGNGIVSRMRSLE